MKVPDTFIAFNTNMQINNFLRPAPHLSYREIKQRYKTADTKRHQRYWNLIRLMSDPDRPLMVKEAAHAAGFSQRWARQLVHRYNESGPGDYGDRRKHNPGNKSLLNESEKAELRESIMQGHTAVGSLWTNVTVRDWIAKKTGQRPSETTGLNYLRDLGFTIQRPRPRHTQAASPEEVAAFKKS